MRRVFFASLICLAGQAAADPAVIEDVTAEQRADGWHFSVTLSHADTGWDDYADGWRIVDPDSGEIYGTRTLLHPHVNEQPFTRSLSGVEIPTDVDVVLIEESTTQTGWAAPRNTSRDAAESREKSDRTQRLKERLSGPTTAARLVTNSRVYALHPSTFCRRYCGWELNPRVGLLLCTVNEDGSFNSFPPNCPLR